MVVSTSSTDEGLDRRDNRWLRRALWRPSRIHPPPAPPHGGLDELDRRGARPKGQPMVEEGALAPVSKPPAARAAAWWSRRARPTRGGSTDEGRLDRRGAARPTRGGSTDEGPARPTRGETPDSGLRGRPG